MDEVNPNADVSTITPLIQLQLQGIISSVALPSKQSTVYLAALEQLPSVSRQVFFPTAAAAAVLTLCQDLSIKSTSSRYLDRRLRAILLQALSAINKCRSLLNVVSASSLLQLPKEDSQLDRRATWPFNQPCVDDVCVCTAGSGGTRFKHR